MALFPLGKLYSTHGVAALQQQDPGFVEFVWRCLERYRRGDWGDMTKADKARNNEAVAAGEDGGRIFAAYERPDYPEHKIWIISESDRSCTTILFPDEY